MCNHMVRHDESFVTSTVPSLVHELYTNNVANQQDDISAITKSPR